MLSRICRGCCSKPVFRFRASDRPLWTCNELVNRVRGFSTSVPFYSKIQVNDRVLLRWFERNKVKTKLTSPLREDGETIIAAHIYVKHKDLIGSPNDTKQEHKSRNGQHSQWVWARHPNLDEYTANAPRLVAPIYANYASTVVNQLDIHVDPPTEENDPTVHAYSQLQILEAGTGHGGLTLQLSRAIAAANPPIPAAARLQPPAISTFTRGNETFNLAHPQDEVLFEDWKRTRRAILHTIELIPEHSRHAEQLIQSYRGGIYWPHVDFHSNISIQDWVHNQVKDRRGQPFLDVVILDLQDIEKQLETVRGAVKFGGQVLVFAPQITQIAACVQEIQLRGMDLKLEKVVELGDNISTGRLWDVRMANMKENRVRARSKIASALDVTTTVQSEIDIDSSRFEQPQSQPFPAMVCRPLVFSEVTRGGGFIASWKRVQPREYQASIPDVD